MFALASQCAAAEKAAERDGEKKKDTLGPKSVVSHETKISDDRSTSIGSGGLHTDTTEVDFFNNPTILSRLVLNEKYRSAITRLKKFPEEASIWVSSKRNPFRGTSVREEKRKDAVKTYNFPSTRISTLEYSVRQLPLHIACANLVRTKHGSTLHPDLESLIVTLIVTYPNGTKEIDHDGKLPLHELIWNDCSAEVISMALLANPPSIHERDRYDRTPLDLNRFRTGSNKEQVKLMLLRGIYFWEQARRVAFAKMYKNKVPEKAAELSSDNLNRSHQAHNQKIEPVTWLKLERRAVHLERLLAGVYEQNYEQGELIEELTTEKVQLQAKIDSLMKVSREHSDGIEASNKSNKKYAPTEGRNTRASAPFDSPNSEDVQRSLHQSNVMLEKELKILREREIELEEKTRRLEIVVDSYYTSNAEAKGLDQGYDDFYSLLQSLRSDSSSATERYLASKVVELEAILRDVSMTKENEVEALQGENRRLRQENERMLSLSDSHHTRSSTGDSGTNQTRSYSSLPETARNPSYSFDRAFVSDNLDDILKEAASVNEDKSHQHLDEYRVAPDGVENKEEAGITLPALLSIALRTYESDLSEPLERALHEASVAADSPNVNKLVVVAERIYGDEIPSDFVHCLHTAAVRVNQSSSSGVNSIYQIQPSREVSTLSEDTDLDTILVEAQAIYGTKLRPSLVEAWKNASVDDPFGTSVKSTGGLERSRESNRTFDDGETEIVSTDDLEAILREAARLYSKPTMPEKTASMRPGKGSPEGSSQDSKVVIQQLKKDSPRVARARSPSAISRISRDTFSTFSTKSDNLEDVLNEAASIAFSDVPGE